jgi:hypothetical protein
MAITITLADETYTLDETAGLQTGADGTPSGTPRDDSDVALSTLQAQAAAFYDYLFGVDTGELGLSTTFPTNVGVASSSTTFIHVTSDANLSTLALTDSDGDAFDGTQSSGLFTTSGKEIFLVSDLNNQVVLGKYDSDDANADLDAVAFAVYMKTDGALGTDEYVQLWSVTFTALSHTVDGDTAAAYDDALDLLQNVSITGTGTKTFNFNDQPAGQNLFGMVGDANDAIIFTGELPVLKGNGEYLPASDTINTSKAQGEDTVIGVDDQSFNPIGGNTNVDDGAFFTYVEDPDTRFLAGATDGLTQNEADDADNVQFGNTKEVSGAFLKIAQVVGNGLASLTLTAYDLTNDTQDGKAFVQNQGSLGGAKVNIDEVYVYSATPFGNSTLVESFSGGSEGGLDATVQISIVNGVASLTGVDDDMFIVWHTVDEHDQVLVKASTGSGPFDIGLFGVLEGQETSASLAGHAFVEDDGPSIGAIPDAIVDFASGATTGAKSLNGATGIDPNSSPYALTAWTASTVVSGVTLTAVPNATGSTPVTAVSYWANTNGVAGIQTTGANPDTEFYRLTLDQTGAGSYTFTVLQDPPIVETQFGFGAQPSGQNLFGIIPTNPNNVSGTSPNATLPDGGLLFFNSGVHVDGDGKYISGNSDPAFNSSTVNTSKGGGEVSIGYGANNYTADGQDAFFVFADNPNTQAVSGIGLTSTTADDADTVRFNGTNEATSASVEIVKIVGSTESGVTIKAWDLDPNDTGTQLNIGDAPSESRNFLTDPLTFGDDAVQIDIDAVRVFSVTKNATTLVYSAVDLNDDGDFDDLNEIPTDTNNVEVTLNSDGSVTVLGLDTNKDYTIRYDTAAPHDMSQVIYETGSYNIGGFNVFQSVATPDQKLDFTARATDGDGDFASDSWSIGIDGTGINDDGLVSGVVI